MQFGSGAAHLVVSPGSRPLFTPDDELVFPQPRLSAHQRSSNWPASRLWPLEIHDQSYGYRASCLKEGGSRCR